MAWSHAAACAGRGPGIARPSLPCFPAVSAAGGCRSPWLGLPQGLARPLLHGLQQPAVGGEAISTSPRGHPPTGCFPCWDRGVVKCSFIAETDPREHEVMYFRIQGAMAEGWMFLHPSA